MNPDPFMKKKGPGEAPAPFAFEAAALAVEAREELHALTRRCRYLSNESTD